MTGARCSSMVEHLLMAQWVVRSIPHGGPIKLFLILPVHNWCNKGCGMYYPVSRMVHIKDSLLLTGNSRPRCGGSRFPLSLSGPLRYNHKIKCVEYVIKIFPSFLPYHGKHFLISSKGYMHQPTDRMVHTITFVIPVVEHWLE